MNERKPMDIIKEIAWNLFVYVLYYIYCFILLLIIHFLLFRIIPSMHWTIPKIAVYALFASTAMMVVRIIGRIRKKR